jgi:hypothetical protein
MVRVLPPPTTDNSNEVMRPEPRRRKRILGQLTRIYVCIRTPRLCYIRALLAGVFSLTHRDSFRSLFTQSAKHPSRRRFLSASSRRPPQAVLSSATISLSSSSWDSDSNLKCSEADSVELRLGIMPQQGQRDPSRGCLSRQPPAAAARRPPAHDVFGAPTPAVGRASDPGLPRPGTDPPASRLRKAPGVGRPAPQTLVDSLWPMCGEWA